MMPDEPVEIEYCHDIILVEVGNNLAKVIKLIRKANHQQLSISEIRELITNPPCKIVDCLTNLAPQKWKENFEEVGASVEFKIY